MSSVPNLEEGLAPSKALVYTVELEKSFFSRWKLLDWLKKQLSAPLLLCAQALSERGFQYPALAKGRNRRGCISQVFATPWYLSDPLRKLLVASLNTRRSQCFLADYPFLIFLHPTLQYLRP